MVDGCVIHVCSAVPEWFQPGLAPTGTNVPTGHVRTITTLRADPGVSTRRESRYSSRSRSVTAQARTSLHNAVSNASSRLHNAVSIASSSTSSASAPLVLRLGIRVVRVRDLEQSAAPDPVSRSSRRSLRPAQPPLPYGQVMISRKLPARVRPVHASTTIAWCRSRQANAVQGRPSTTGRGLGSGQVFRRSRPR